MKRVSLDGIVSMLLLFNLLYMCVATILGLRHSSTVYIAYSMSVAIIAITRFVFHWARGMRLQLVALLGLVLVAIFSVVALNAYFNSGNYYSSRNASFFLMFALPAYVMGCCCDERLAEEMMRYFDLVMIILLVAAVLYITRGVSLRVDESGMNYQNASYAAALALGIDLFFIRNRFSGLRFGFTRSTSYRIIQYLMIPISILVLVASGGRGGIALGIEFAGLFLIGSLRVRGHTARVVFAILVTFGVLIFAMSIADTTVVQRGMQRFMQVFKSGSLIRVSNAAADSIDSRNVIRNTSLELFDKAPYTGYGLFGYAASIGGYPHNLILELMLQGGFFYCLLMCVGISVIMCRAFVAARGSQGMSAFLLPLVQVLTELMFSGTYLAAPTLWFLFGVFANYSFTNEMARHSQAVILMDA